MKAMILAAGRGQRMRPLTDDTPKPLLSLAGRPLIDWHLRALVRAGAEEVVINTAWLGERIQAHVGDGGHWGVRVRYSHEGDAGLETGGGIHRALPVLGTNPFWVVNGDVWTDFDPADLPVALDGLAHLVLVPNPPHHPEGDFCLDGAGRIRMDGEGEALTFAGIGCYDPALFDGMAPGSFRLAPLLRQAAERGAVTATRYDGDWFDIGTPQRLEAVDAYLRRGGGGR